ncbi:hypothetical protein niasHT_001434 [Heterodera trifolii]|uniref:Uncharacterized protein n=1 Tax=Heterodera trifolii TaxID=157864 RepID=A0ABD2LRJ0_9BILA
MLTEWGTAIVVLCCILLIAAAIGLVVLTLCFIRRRRRKALDAKAFAPINAESSLSLRSEQHGVEVPDSL